MTYKSALRNQMLELVQKFHPAGTRPPFRAGEDLVRYAGRHFDEHQIVNLVALSTLKLPTLRDRAVKPGDEVVALAAAGFPTTVNPIIQNRAGISKRLAPAWVPGTAQFAVAY